MRGTDIMFRPRTALAAALLTAGLAGGAAVVALDPAAGAAAPSCVAWSSMPAKVAMTARHTVIHAVLHGTSGCTSAAHDYGATATLHGPKGAHEAYQQWSRMGSTEKIDILITVERRGTYTMRDGDIQVYDSGEVRVPSAWHDTAMVVRNGSRFTSVHRGGSVTATLSHYTEFGWRASAGTIVALQQRSTSGWRTVARVHASRTGAVSVDRRVAGGRNYRLVSASSPTVWGATATVR